MPPPIVPTPPSPAMGWRLSFDVEKLLPINNASQRLKFTLLVQRPGSSDDYGAVLEIFRTRKPPANTQAPVNETLFSITLPDRATVEDDQKNKYKFTGTLCTDFKATDQLGLRLIINNSHTTEAPQEFMYPSAHVRLRKQETT